LEDFKRLQLQSAAHYEQLQQQLLARDEEWRSKLAQAEDLKESQQRQAEDEQLQLQRELLRTTADLKHRLNLQQQQSADFQQAEQDRLERLQRHSDTQLQNRRQTSNVNLHFNSLDSFSNRKIYKLRRLLNKNRLTSISSNNSKIYKPRRLLLN
jgi:hypothetical protein